MYYQRKRDMDAETEREIDEIVVLAEEYWDSLPTKKKNILVGFMKNLILREKLPEDAQEHVDEFIMKYSSVVGLMGLYGVAVLTKKKHKSYIMSVN